MNNNFDVIIVGGGHAGIEAASASARMGIKTLLLTHNIDTIGQMSCNPSIGGIGKSHLVKEIDALGGLMAKATDQSGIHFRVLNASKGKAVRATRAQTDRILYKKAILKLLSSQSTLQILQQTVDDLIIENSKVTGLITNLGIKFSAKAIVLTVGTFLNGKIHIGLKSFSGGRAGDPPSIALAEKLRSLPFRVGRLKTGTPPRLSAKSIDFSRLTIQPGDKPVPVFSFLGNPEEHPLQVLCHLTHTNEKTHDIIRTGLNESPLYTGLIESTGPRYCPSIEDKILRFKDKPTHQIFLEPEGLDSNEIYPNGISTSLSTQTQIDLVRSIKGLESSEILRFGYAIEYDFFDPRDLKYSLETKSIRGLFFAGQINGTTGYEEAAAQGLIAGLNAALQVNNQESWCPKREEAYIGVMIDDLITCGTNEPYRMFTSRAEYRLMLREDNADLRLTDYGRKLGLVDDNRWQAFNEKIKSIDHITKILKKTSISSTNKKISIDQDMKAYELLRRPEVTLADLISGMENPIDLPDSIISEQIEIQAKYEGYIERQSQEIAKHKRYVDMKIPTNFDYNLIKGLSNEVKQKFQEIRPTTIAQASRIPGITPAATSLLIIYLKKSL